MAISPNILDRELGRFVESPTRPGQTAVEVVGQVSVLNTIDDDEVINYFSEVSAVNPSALTNVLSLTFAPGYNYFLKKIEFSGTQMSEVSVEISSSVVAKKRLSLVEFNTDFYFENLPLAAGVNLLVRVLHNRSGTGDFNANVIYSRVAL